MDNFAVTEEYQAKVLACMLADPTFCDAVAAHLKLEHFSNKALQWFFDKLTSETKHTAITLREELITAAKAKHIKEDQVSKYVEIYGLVKEKPVPFEETHIRNQLTRFIRTQAVKNALVESVSLAKSEQWGDILQLMESATGLGLDFNDTGYDYFQELQNRVELRASDTFNPGIPTGIPQLDDITNGGIRNGQCGLVVGGTGRGKSVFLQWLSRTGILLGKKVLYVTLELNKDQIADRFDAMFAQVQPQSLTDYQEQVLQEVGQLGTNFGKSLIIKHFPSDTATIPGLKAFIKTLTLTGIKPDMVIIDYLDLLAPHRHYNSAHEETNAIMKATIGLAQEFDLAVWTAAQLNRAGLVQETPDEASIAGYVGTQYHADMVLWMAQTKEEKEAQIMRLWVSKNRNGLTGRTIKLRTEYEFMTFFKEELTEVTEDSGDVEENKEFAKINRTQERRDLQLLYEELEQPAPAEDNDGFDFIVE